MKPVTAIILGVSLIVASVIGGYYFKVAKAQPRTLRVVGMATKRINSDVAKWQFTISRNLGVNEMKQGYQKMADDVEMVKKILSSRGIVLDSLTVQPVSVNTMYDNNGHVTGNKAMVNMYIVSKNVDNLEKIAQNPATFASEDIILETSHVDYYNSRLDTYKKELLAAATTNALERAEEMANAARAKVDKITTARAGVFQITAPMSTDVEDYGIYDTSSKDKDIKVTMSAEFTLR